MGNYYSGKIDLYIDAKKISLKNLISKVNLLVNNKMSYYLCLRVNDENMSDDDFIKILNYDNIEINSTYDNKYRISEDIIKSIESFSEYIYDYIIMISTNTKYFRQNNCEESIIKLIDTLKPYKDDEVNNNVGTIKDEDHDYTKDFVWDYKEFKNEIKSREYLCRDCDDYSNDSLCILYNICKRVYNIGYENGHKDNVMYWDR
ncbi:MAG: hypothetical protein IKR19_07890 [Acholeplasmatales bacterium]|nr:hypothetical protein [Acholeplasmatales bacterium]